jgi:hypothetical protein
MARLPLDNTWERPQNVLRISYPSLILQTAGHEDFSPAYEAPKALRGPPSHSEELGEFTVANGVPKVLGAVRNETQKGRQIVIRCQDDRRRSMTWI